MISRCGLLDLARATACTDAAGLGRRSTRAFDAYRAKAAMTASDEAALPQRRARASTFHSTPIFFIGVWDTVGALGVPDDLALLKLIDDPAGHSFHDTALSPVVAHARHAVAMDENRGDLRPDALDRAATRTAT